jgi:hypothetical protein
LWRAKKDSHLQGPGWSRFVWFVNVLARIKSGDP